METIETIVPFSATPPRFIADANYNEHIVRGLRRRRPDMQITTVHQERVDHLPDPDILAYAAEHDLFVLTHDVHTMPKYFAEYLLTLPEGAYSPGVWYTPQSLPVGTAILAILETWLCSAHNEYRNRELRLP
ncbi:MAG: DUF5615 family PIN-like protein [Nitrososphaerota archaeon]